MPSANQGCVRCFLPPTFPGLSLDDEGVCTRCRELATEGARQERERSRQQSRLPELQRIADQIRAERQRTGSRYDCIIGASGGLDSTYMVYVAKAVMGLEPLVVKYDNGFSHDVATRNLREACERLGVECRVIPPIPRERKYIEASVRGLEPLGVYFSACFSCHYTILSVVYQIARQENISYTLTNTNEVEHSLSQASHGFMLMALVKGFVRSLPFKACRVAWYELVAAYHLFRLKLHFDGFSWRLIANQFRLHPRPPQFLKKVILTDHIAWDLVEIEKTLRRELGWRSPKNLKVPYLRFDCHFSGLIDKSFKNTTGICLHALLLNHFVQTGDYTRDQLSRDFSYLDGDRRIDREVEIALARLRRNGNGD